MNLIGESEVCSLLLTSCYFEFLAHMKFAKPVLDRVFGGSLLQIICCSECNHESVCFEPFLDLSLSIPRNVHNAQQNQQKLNPFLSKNQKKKANKKNKKVIKFCQFIFIQLNFSEEQEKEE